MDSMEEFNGALGGYWYLFEKGDDPRNFPIEDDYTVDLLSDERNWCDSAALERNCFIAFMGMNNAGGPCQFVPDAPWIPEMLRRGWRNSSRGKGRHNSNAFTSRELTRSLDLVSSSLSGHSSEGT